MKDSELIALIERAIEVEEKITASKPFYKERDEITNKILRADNIPPVIEVRGYVVTLKDNFAIKNTAWKACGVSRFELEIIKK